MRRRTGPGPPASIRLAPEPCRTRVGWVRPPRPQAIHSGLLLAGLFGPGLSAAYRGSAMLREVDWVSLGSWETTGR